MSRGHNQVVPVEVRSKVHAQLSTNYNFNDINDDMLVALEEGCLKEFEDWKDNWVWLCSHFQELHYVKKAKANKSNLEKKTLLHHSCSKPFSYKIEIDVFSAFMFDPGMSWPSPFIQSGIRLPDLRPPSTSEPLQPEHAPNLETFQPPPNDDPVDYAALFS
ncbi:hypothetical protein D8674_008827 [Pyrus ussuriensis x Pyrus communis]|uniref:Uncharacterized protein n=1 Tax=Pyrus ussuriensis x Pyrus communis TaxID=2448454 RepID=A0A5N5HUU6_9ROSA|nr:hypothetical protein D8674_008827 [Pyrus ussuriensis x Pyrus communis]